MKVALPQPLRVAPARATALAAPHCHTEPPTLDAVGALAKLFDVSLTVACQRWAELSPHPCAYVEASGGKIKRAVRSTTFRGEAVRGRPLEADTLARALPADPAAPRVHDVAWGAAALTVPVVESCATLGDHTTLVWLWHAG